MPETEISKDNAAPLSFDQVIEESKASIAEQAQAQTKRPRGRPFGTTKKDKAPESPSMENPSAENGPASVPVPNDLKPLIKEAVKTPFSLFAHKFDEEKIELTEKEAETPAIYLSKYLSLIMPDLESKGPKEFNLIAFLISFCMLALKKLPHLRKKISKNPAPAKQDDIQTSKPAHPEGDVPPDETFPPRVGAGNYFAKGN